MMTSPRRVLALALLALSSCSGNVDENQHQNSSGHMISSKNFVQKLNKEDDEFYLHCTGRDFSYKTPKIFQISFKVIRSPRDNVLEYDPILKDYKELCAREDLKCDKIVDEASIKIDTVKTIKEIDDTTITDFVISRINGEFRGIRKNKGHGFTIGIFSAVGVCARSLDPLQPRVI